MNQFLGFFFLSPTNDCIFFLLKTQNLVSVSQCLTRGRRKNKEKKIGKKGIREGMRR